MKENCWEFKKCGREKGGKNSLQLGVCPVYTLTESDGRNGGRNGGRYCWKVAGTFCGGKVQGTWAMKMSSCVKCDFFQHLKEQEGEGMLF